MLLSAVKDDDGEFQQGGTVCHQKLLRRIQVADVRGNAEAVLSVSCAPRIERRREGEREGESALIMSVNL